jgi:hypothetical protein
MKFLQALYCLILISSITYVFGNSVVRRSGNIALELALTEVGCHVPV